MYRNIITFGKFILRYTAIYCTLMTSVAADTECLERFCPERVVSRDVVVDWHRYKDSLGPTFAGTSSWNSYMELIESHVRRMGLIDLRHNPFDYTRWQTSEWPDRSGWSLRIGDHDINVANYGANSGDTGPEGVTAPIVVLKGTELSALSDPAILKGKIVVLRIESTDFQRQIPDWLYAPPDYPYTVGQWLKAEDTVSASTASQLFAANLKGKLPFPEPHYLKLIRQSRAAGVALIFDMVDERVQGLYSFPVPEIYDVPTLYLGREAGRDLLTAARNHDSATLTLNAEEVSARAYQFSAILPGRDYGTDRDEVILMISHTDGPSISQENGPLGLLSILHYFTQFNQEERDKSLMLFLDSRHFIPDREASLPDYDIEQVLGPAGAMALNKGQLIASVHLEHLGQVEYAEREGRYLPTGQMESGGYYVTGYQAIIDIAERAMKLHQPYNQVLRSTDVPGIHGQSQGHWFGLGHHPRRLGIEAIASNMVSMGAYWTINGGLRLLRPRSVYTPG